MAPVIGLCVLVAADAVLIGWAFRGTTLEEPPTSTVARTVVSTPTPTPTAPDVVSGAPTLEVVPLTRTVAAWSATEAWVFDAGTCAKPGPMWTTTDAGATWSREKTPGSVLRAKLRSATTGFVTGGDTKCRLKLWGTGDMGAGWVGPSSPSDAWSRVHDDPAEVLVPSGQRVRPCGTDVPVIDLAGVDLNRARVVCGDGSLRSTTEGGSGEWSDDGLERTGALAIGAADRTSAMLVRSAKGCKGVVTLSLRNGKPVGQEKCVVTKAAPGKVAIAGSERGWWLAVGDTVFRYEDKTWVATAAKLTTG